MTVNSRLAHDTVWFTKEDILSVDRPLERSVDCVEFLESERTQVRYQIMKGTQRCSWENARKYYNLLLGKMANGVCGRWTYDGLFPADKEHPLRYPAAYCGYLHLLPIDVDGGGLMFD
jgi:hypothetical protein